MVDLLLHNATLRTMAATAPDAEAVAITGGKIAAVGASADLSNAASPATRRIDLGGRTLLPGFNDAHVHIWKVGQLLTTVADLRGADSFAAISDLLHRQPTDGWLQGRGVNELRLAEGRLPTRHDLDSIVADRPVLLTRTCGHVAIANSRALELAGVDVDSNPPAGGEIYRDNDGSPNGVFTETAMALVQRAMPNPTPSDYEAMITAAIDHQLRLGITAATDPGVDDTLLGAYQQMDAEGRLPGRYNVMRFPEGVDGPPATATDHLRIDTVKFFMDGGLSGATAALTRPYRHADTTGVLRLPTDDLLKQAAPLACQGWRIATHVIGDAAIDAAIEAYAQLPRVDMPHRLEHLGLPTDEHLQRVAGLGIGVATQAIFLPELGANFEQYLPLDFGICPYPIKSMIEAGVGVALSSDAPVVVNDNTLAGVRAALDRQTDAGGVIGEHESISINDALLAYTKAGAALAGQPHEYGTIEPGRWADLVVLDRDPLATPVRELDGINVDMTLVDGKVAFER